MTISSHHSSAPNPSMAPVYLRVRTEACSGLSSPSIILCCYFSDCISYSSSQAHSTPATLAFWPVLKYTGAAPTPGPLHLLFLQLECSSPNICRPFPSLSSGSCFSTLCEMVNPHPQHSLFPSTLFFIELINNGHILSLLFVISFTIHRNIISMRSE